MKIRIDVDASEYSEQSFEDTLRKEIVNNIAEKILSEQKGKLRAEIDAHVFAAVCETISDEIKKHLEKGIQETNKWGEPTGKPTTMIQVISSKIDAWFKEQVWVRDGKIETDSYYHNGSRATKKTVLNFFLDEYVKQTLEKEFKAQITQAVADLKKSVDGKFSDIIRDAIKKLA